MNEQGWMKMLRILATCGGFVAMYISASFSADGFSIRNQELYWIGWLLAFLIVIVEFTWRKPGMEENLTMSIIGIGAYVFGVVTNVVGILKAMGITENYFQDFAAVLIAVLTGLFLEVMPEPFVSWGVTGKSMADMFGEAQKMLNNDARIIPQYKGRSNSMNQNFNKPMQEQHFSKPQQGNQPNHRPDTDPEVEIEAMLMGNSKTLAQKHADQYRGNNHNNGKGGQSHKGNTFPGNKQTPTKHR